MSLRRYFVPKTLAPYLIAFLLAFIPAFIHIVQYTKFSPIDELRHLDYALQITSGHVPKLGDKLRQDAMREEACRGIDYQWLNPPCDSLKFKPAAFRDYGYQTASPHPPAYYILSGISGRTFRGLGIFDGTLVGARLMSALLFGLGFVATFAAGRQLGVRSFPLLAGLGMLLTMPGALHSASIVTPDSFAMLAGGGALLSAILWKKNLLSDRWLILVGALVGLTKLTNLVMLLAVVAWLVVDALVQKRADQKFLSLTKAPALMFSAGALTSGAWIFSERMRATISPDIVPQNISLKFNGIPPLKHLLNPEVLLTWFPPGRSFDSARFFNQYVSLMRSLVFPLLIGAIIVSALRVQKGRDIESLSLFAGLAGLVGAPVFVLGTAISAGILIGAEGRYAVCLLPAYVIAVASHSKGRVGDVLLGLIGGSAWIICSYAILVG
jgi:4-amino-4-deoxy-L-arabinose transferase-like glycosyltransferase